MYILYVGKPIVKCKINVCKFNKALLHITERVVRYIQSN